MAPVTLMMLSAWGATPIEEARMAELERARGEVANQVQLSAYDLLDELVYGLAKEPIFATPTPVVLAGVTVPVGLGTGLQALLENHLADLLLQNPGTNLRLVHCPTCTAVVVHSGPEGTVISRGIDNPRVLGELGGATGRHALFVDVEAEGTFLVLRARLTGLTPELPIVWSHTLSTSASTPALLRESEHLKSATEAREEYLAVLQGRSPLTVPVRLGVRAYDRPNGDNGGTAPPPMLWVQSGVELSTTDARLWTGSFLLGYSLIPQAYQGLMGQVRVGRLLTGRYRSLTRPDLYLFAGGAVMSVWGPATGSFSTPALNVDQIIAQLEGDDPRASFGALHVGADVRVGSRVGASVFLETLPGFWDSNNFGDYVTFAQIPFQAFGTEVTFCF